VLRYSTDRRYRPHIHPLYAPGTDRPLTRFRPVDHPWQYGLYVGLNDVNGIDFWCCGDAYYPPETWGSIRNRHIETAGAAGTGVEFTAVNDWHGPAGQAVAEERQTWRVAAPESDADYTVDLDWELHALDEPLAIGAYDYGGLTIRMVGDLESVRLIDSEGRRDGECIVGPASWTSMAHPIDGVGTYIRDADDPLAYSYAGVAMFNHPSNALSPPVWRIGLGLMSPSPQATAPFRIPAGESVSFRYRLQAFTGMGDANALARAYADWTR
jgi:hypothetical protein